MIGAIDKELARRLRLARHREKMTAEEVAGLSGLGVQSYKLGENGERRFRAAELHRITKVLNWSLSDLFRDLPTRV